MALSVKKGTWTGDGSTPQSTTGLGFTPKAILVWGTGPGATDAITAGMTIGIGIGTCRDAVTQNDTGGMAYADNVSTNSASVDEDVVLLTVLTDNALSIDYSVSLSTFDADGFTVTYSNATNASGDVFHYLAIGGADLTDANVIAGTVPTSGATFDVTGFGFQPDGAIIVFIPQVLGSSGSVGFIGTNGVEGSATAGLTTAAVTMASGLFNDGYVSATSAIIALRSSSDAVSVKADFNAWLADGIRFNLVTPAATGGVSIFILGLKGGTYVVGSKAKATAAAADTYTTTGLTPKAVLVAGSRTVTALDTVTVAGSALSIGGGTSTDGTQEGSASTVLSETIPTQADRQQSTTKAFALLTTAAAATLQTAADLTALANGSFELTWSATGTAERLIYMAMGDAPPSPTARSPGIHPGLKTPGR